MKIGVIYARYSSDSQSEQSIEGQLRVCNQYAENNDIRIVETYIDRAMTGTNDNRPDFQRMIKDSGQKTWDFVIVYKLDRFSRDKYETTIHKHTLKVNGVKVVSAMENIPDSPEGIILESLLEGMNQYYSAELSQKVQRGLKESYIKGQFTGGYQLYGYNVVDKKNIINPVEAEIVQEIFTKYAQGFTAIDIVKSLKERGLKTNRDLSFTDKKIYKIIQNVKYNGKVKHGDTVYTNIYPAIIDDVLWQKVQTIRQSFKHHTFSKQQDKREYLLSGKLICGYCKRKITGEGGKVKNKVILYRYYNCLTQRRLKDEYCEFKPVRRELLEDRIMDITWKVLSNNNNLRKITKSILSCRNSNNNADLKIKSLENSRTSLLKSAQNLISAVEQGIVTEQTKFRLKELESHISILDEEIEIERQRNLTYLTEDLIMDYFKKIICGDIQDNSVRKQIIKTFIREVILYNDETIIIYNYTDQIIPKSIIPDDVNEIDIEAIRNKALNEKTINNNADLKFLFNEQYFGVYTKK
jgi:site-specific DNA recombinase